MKTKQNNFENIYIFLIFSLFWTGSLLAMGTLSSGFHLFDDKDLFSIYTELENSGFLQTFKQYIISDNGSRFRPLYIFYRILQVSLFGYNLYYISLSYLGFAIFSSFFFFKFFRYSGIQTNISILLTFYTLVGAHASIWWKLGTNENLGVLFTSLALMLLAKSIDQQKPLWEYLSWGALIIGSLAKESFVLFIPGFVGMSLILKYLRNPGNHTFYTLFRRNLFMVLLMALVFFADLFIILYVVEHGVEYSQVDKLSEENNVFFFIKKMYLFFKNKIFFFAYFLLNLFVWFFGLFLNFQNLESPKNRKITILSLGTLNFIIIFVPQFFLHVGLGFTERYLLPLHFSFPLFFLTIIVLMNESGEVNRFSKNTFNGLILVLTIFFFLSGFVTYGRDFTAHGKAVTQMLEKINQDSQVNRLLIVLEESKNIEYGISVNTYLTFFDPEKRVYYKNLDQGTGEALSKIEYLLSNIVPYTPFFENPKNVKELKITSAEIFDAILILPERNRSEIPVDPMLLPGFTEYRYDPFTLFLKK